MSNWTYRIEPVPAADDIEDGLAARIHDPLWLLARQWQLGEFAGNDAGSPALVRVRGTTTPVGAFGSGVTGAWRPYDRRQVPLDVMIEAESERLDERTLLQQGSHFLRLLAADGLSRYVDDLRQAFAFAERGRQDGDDPLLALLRDTTPDPGALAPALESFVEGADTALPFVAAADRERVCEVARAWLAWREAEIGGIQPPASQCWEPHRLEHHALLASAAAGGTVLRARQYVAESLDWTDFDIDPETEPPAVALAPPQPLKLQGIPAPIRYGGMPAARFWELEDGRIDFGRVEAGAHDLGRLLLVQFAIVFGNDWFLVPLRVPSGTLTRLDDVIVSDVFGEHYLVTRAGAADPTWDLFALDVAGATAHAAQGALFLPPSFGLRLEGEPLELVHLLRDEMANLAWGVERIVTSDEGVTSDRLEAWRRRPLPARPPDGELPRYSVETEVPDYWLPLVPEQLDDRRSHRLVLVPLAAQSTGGPTLTRPLGQLLSTAARGERFWLFEEEVPRAGVSVARLRRYVRWHGGRSYLWTARARRPGRGEGSSGLRYDVVLPE